MNIPSKPASIDVEIHGNFIDGREVEAGAGAMLDVRNPATGGVSAGVTYIAFKGTTVAQPRSATAIARAGRAAVTKFLAQN